MLSVSELHLRAALFRWVRTFFWESGFLEVDTPIRQPLLIPEKNITPLPSGDWLLQASPELCMKRLLAAGCQKIFQICPCFRAHERGRLHLEEFMMLEWYRTGADYRALMKDCESLICFLREKMLQEFPNILREGLFCNAYMDLTSSWEKLTLKEAFSRYSPVALSRALQEDRFEELLTEYIEPRLGFGAPLFLYEYPADHASLAKIKETDTEVAERFELYINGIELANGFSELTDADEQRRRFKIEMEHVARKMEMPERFLTALDVLDRAAGIAFGLDRLFMLILGKKTIDEAIAFAPGDL